MLKIVAALCIGTTVLLAACSDEPTTPSKLVGPLTLQNWASQDQATNVQDWHRMAQKIADAMQARGLLGAAPNGPGSVAVQSFYVRADQNTPFAHQLSQALRAEILRRQGLLTMSAGRGDVIDLGVDIVIWGSRVRSDPQRIRSEAVWHATINSQNNVVMTIQEPFYIFSSDVPLYVETSRPDPELLRGARPLRYFQ